jgi:glycosyltransferase involved in cell wall biosynthesis
LTYDARRRRDVRELRGGSKRRFARVALASVLPARTSRTGPLVTVLIPTYNWSSVLRCAIESVRRQTYRNWELIVVGDGCTDDSEAVVASFGDPRIRWTNLPENSGSQSTPNNAGIELARGKYIAYLGHDDIWFPEHLGRLVTAAERKGAGLAVSICLSLGPSGSNIRRLQPVRPFAQDVSAPPSAVLHRRDLVAELGGWQDYRELVKPPVVEFIARMAASPLGWAETNVLTACKFNSALRPNSYRERRSEEQQEALARTSSPRRLSLRLLADVAWIRFRRLAEQPPAYAEPPAEVPPGWYVSEWRRMRGLDDIATPPKAPPTSPSEG